MYTCNVLSIIISQRFCYTVIPLNTADLGTAAVFRKRRYIYCESYIAYKTHIWDLKMGGGIGRAAVLGERY